MPSTDRADRTGRSPVRLVISFVLLVALIALFVLGESEGVIKTARTELGFGVAALIILWYLSTGLRRLRRRRGPGDSVNGSVGV